MPSTFRRARLRSFAKINLDLRVLHKRNDGFHEMRSVFHTISLADSIDVSYEAARRTEISLDDPVGIPENLIVRAARATLEAMRTNARVHFRLDKKIPMGGGLGGGSSNAAAVVMALPALAGQSLPMETSIEIAVGLGSDVPFFLLGGAAVGTGRGIELYPLPDLRPEPLLLILSRVHVATAEAYRALNRGANCEDSAHSLRSFQDYVWALEQGGSAAQAARLAANDFEGSVFRGHPELGAIHAKVSKIASKFEAGGARMTGSGSAIFALFHSVEDRRRAEEAMRQERALKECRLLRAVLFDRRKYRKNWRSQLRPSENC